MAKKCQINRDNRRRQLIDKYAEKRASLRKRLNDPEVSIEEKLEVQQAFAKLPRNSCPTRLNLREGDPPRCRRRTRIFALPTRTPWARG